MEPTLPSPLISEGADKRSKAFEALWEIILSGDAGHPALIRKLRMAAMAGDADGSTKQMPWAPATAFEIVRHGVPSRALIAFGNFLGVGRGALADVVGLNRATAARKVASDQPLPMHVAESVLRLLELQWLAKDTFGSHDTACAWLVRGHPMLEGEAPLDRVKSAYGSERVKEILVALKYGGAV